MIYLPALRPEHLNDQGHMQQWCDQMMARLSLDARAGSQRYQITVREDAERHLFLPQVEIISSGWATDYPFSHEFFQSGEYLSFVKLGEQIANLLEEGAYVQMGDRKDRKI